MQRSSQGPSARTFKDADDAFATVINNAPAEAVSDAGAWRRILLLTTHMGQTVCEVGACSRPRHCAFQQTKHPAPNARPRVRRYIHVGFADPANMAAAMRHPGRQCILRVWCAAPGRAADLGNILQFLKLNGTVAFDRSAEDNCDGKGSVTARGPSAVLAERRRRRKSDCPKSVPSVSARNAVVVRYWRRYVSAGFFKEPRCQAPPNVLALRANLSSSCDRPALARARGEPIQVDAKYPKSWRYFTATPCEEAESVFLKTPRTVVPGRDAARGRASFSKPRLVMPARWRRG